MIPKVTYRRAKRAWLCGMFAIFASTATWAAEAETEGWSAYGQLSFGALQVETAAAREVYFA